MELINSFFNNIKDKLTNPFFGTLILVLIFHHWELWYSVLNFDSNHNLEDKLIFIKQYIYNNVNCISILKDLGLALLYMFFGYLIVVGTRSLVLWIEFYLMPLITGKIVNKTVVRKSEYDEVIKEREQYFDQYEIQRKQVRDFSKTIDEQHLLIKQKDSELILQSQSISTALKELDTLKKEYNDSQKANTILNQKIQNLEDINSELNKELNSKLELLKGYEDLYFNNKNKIHFTSYEDFSPEIIEKVKELKKDSKWNSFISVGNFFTNSGTISGEVIDEMIKRKLVFEREKREGLTAIGRIIYFYRTLFEKV